MRIGYRRSAAATAAVASASADLRTGSASILVGFRTPVILKGVRMTDNVHEMSCRQ